MTAKAILSNYRQSPRKVRLVANLIKGKKVEDALTHVKMLDKRAAPAMVKLIQSAVSNAKSLGMDTTTLYVVEIRVDKGTVLKRSMPRAMGRAFPIHKHSSHVSVVLDEKRSTTKKTAEKQEATTTASTPPTAKKSVAKKVAAKKTKSKK